MEEEADGDEVGGVGGEGGCGGVGVGIGEDEGGEFGMGEGEVGGEGCAEAGSIGNDLGSGDVAG